jgi:hypothetical protein
MAEWMMYTKFQGIHLESKCMPDLNMPFHVYIFLESKWLQYYRTAGFDTKFILNQKSVLIYIYYAYIIFIYMASINFAWLSKFQQFEESWLTYSSVLILRSLKIALFAVLST